MKDHLGNEGGEILRTAKRLKKKLKCLKTLKQKK